jgi:hypothetical protein
LADGGERPLRTGFAWALVVNLACLGALVAGAPLPAAALGAAAAECVVAWRATAELARRGALEARGSEALGPSLAVASLGAATWTADSFAPAAARVLPAVAGVCLAAYALVGGPGRAFRAALREASD